MPLLHRNFLTKNGSLGDRIKLSSLGPSIFPHSLQWSRVSFHFLYVYRPADTITSLRSSWISWFALKSVWTNTHHKAQYLQGVVCSAARTLELKMRKHVYSASKQMLLLSMIVYLSMWVEELAKRYLSYRCFCSSLNGQTHVSSTKSRYVRVVHEFRPDNYERLWHIMKRLGARLFHYVS